MPLYEYQCIPNNHRFEVRQGFNDEPVKTCTECGAAVRRVIQPVGIVFKGSGFYATDSRKSASDGEKKPVKSGSTDSKPESAAAESSDSKPSTASESKPETKSEPKSESKPSS